jgi:N-acetylglucosaminyldiphosphoundecaprenol N-acetyl-beta-D-mannosaminyltransferase
VQTGAIVPALAVTSVSDGSERANVLGVGISAINMDSAVLMTDSLLQSEGRGYICLTGVHGVMEAQADQALRQILNESFLTAPDGMPMVWIGRLQGHTRMRRVFGPDFMAEMCRVSVGRGYRHFFYGGREGVAEELRNSLMRTIPGLNIVGIFTPPYGPLNRNGELELERLVAETKPDIFWVGLGTPAQEHFMADYVRRLDVKVMVGVGAAFDFHTGRLKDAPDWIKAIGMQWLHRLIQEPRRLWHRYLTNNPKFIWNISLQVLGVRKHRIDN